LKARSRQVLGTAQSHPGPLIPDDRIGAGWNRSTASGARAAWKGSGYTHAGRPRRVVRTGGRIAAIPTGCWRQLGRPVRGSTCSSGSSLADRSRSPTRRPCTGGGDCPASAAPTKRDRPALEVAGTSFFAAVASDSRTGKGAYVHCAVRKLGGLQMIARTFQ